MTQQKLCLNCNNVIPWAIRPGTKWRISKSDYLKRKFCDNKCKNEYASKITAGKNNPNWKGGKPKCIDCRKTLKYFGHNRCLSCHKKNITGSKNPNYKGNSKLNYQYLHFMIRKELGNPRKCEFCGKTGDNRQIQWANKNHKYNRTRSDWIALCVKCHRKHDKFLKMS